MNKSLRRIANAALAIAFISSCFLGVPQQALAQEPSPATVVICFRGRTVTVPSYLLSRYIAAGATAGACVISPP